MTDMWAYVYDTDQTVRKKKVPLPELRSNDVLVKIDRVSICGSDLHIFDNDDWAKESVTPGIVIGHEGCGRIVSLGNGVTEFEIGDYVALESHFACPQCESQGKTADECPHYGIIGIHGSQSGSKDHTVGGVFAEYISIPYYCCHSVSPKIRDSLPSSLLEPAGNSLEIVRYLKQNRLPETLAVFGCGPHGLNLQLFARYAGIENIVAFEVDPWRLEFARNFAAAHHVVNPAVISDEEIFRLSGGEGFDIAIDMVGNTGVVEHCKKVVRNNGEVILFGLPRHESLIAHGENFAQIIFNNESLKIDYRGKRIYLRGFTGRTKETWKELIESLEKSEYLREKIARPIHYIGNLHELENFINYRPDHFLKIGLTQFE